jgi:N-acetylneuraminate synthase
VYVVAEIGVNHNGDLGIAKKLIDAAVQAGCDAVKFQKRTPELCVPHAQRKVMRDTPWGYMSYMEYRKRVEFGFDEFLEIDKHCKARGILWFASCWDEPSVDFIEQFVPPCYKVASATLTDGALLRHTRATGRPVILSTGMSTMEQIRTAVKVLGDEYLIITHSTSTYPCDVSELNLRMLETLHRQFPCPIGYSGHEVGLATTVAAVTLGAQLIERHITLDRSMWGSDHAASVEPEGFQRLVKYVRTVEKALGTGTKEVYASELPILRRLRRMNTLSAAPQRGAAKSRSSRRPAPPAQRTTERRRGVNGRAGLRAAGHADKRG